MRAEGETQTTGRLLIDATAYAQRVLLQGKEPPWHEATACANHLRNVQDLLGSQVALVPLDRMMGDEIRSNPELAAAMRARSRPGFAVRTLLADAALKRAANRLVSTLSVLVRVPIVLQLPSPLTLMHATASRASPNAGSVSFEEYEEHAERASVYFADWLRTFAEAGVAGILFDERLRASAAEDYQSVMNVAQHYRWVVGTRGDTEVRFWTPSVVVPVVDWGSLVGRVARGPAADRTIFTEVPEGAVPERVLEVLGVLRAQRAE